MIYVFTFLSENKFSPLFCFATFISLTIYHVYLSSAPLSSFNFVHAVFLCRWSTLLASHITQPFPLGLLGLGSCWGRLFPPRGFKIIFDIFFKLLKMDVCVCVCVCVYSFWYILLWMVWSGKVILLLFPSPRHWIYHTLLHFLAELFIRY